MHARSVSATKWWPCQGLPTIDPKLLGTAVVSVKQFICPEINNGTRDVPSEPRWMSQVSVACESGQG